MEIIKDAKDLLTLNEAALWASNFLHKSVNSGNISYLIQYAHIRKIQAKGVTKVSLTELKNYYLQNVFQNKNKWETDKNINWALSFSCYKEAETTKHVHRLHPYKGKFIPQLVEYFIDTHTDNFKKQVYFNKGDIVLDPFCGSGTTLVQSLECSLNAIGIDISVFNALIANCKVNKIDIFLLIQTIDSITEALESFYNSTHLNEFEMQLNEKLNAFNTKHFSSYEYKCAIREKTLDEKQYSKQKVAEFLPQYNLLCDKYHISLQLNDANFITKWFLPNIQKELYFVKDIIAKIKDENIKNMLILLLSRVMRSCRATTHSDLATLQSPVTSPYYCTKHYKICRPLFSIKKWWNNYAKDTVSRLLQFDKLRGETSALCLVGDSRNIDIRQSIPKDNALYDLLQKQKIKGIFSSPPYVGLIDYHEQHAYAYELFDLKRQDSLEIGSLSMGQTKEAQLLYTQDIAQVLINCKRFLACDYDVFLVANDKYNLYPTIANKAKMKIVDCYKRPVLNRSERTKNAYSETIFHLKEQ